MLFEKLHSLGIGEAGSRWLDLGTGIVVFPRKLCKYGADILAADISEEQLKLFDQEHRAMLEEKYPEKFGIRHKIFLTWYRF